MVLFTITCTTCKAKLKVRHAAAIGQILGCPKCGSMVQVAAPEGWKPAEPGFGAQRHADDSDRISATKLASATGPGVSTGSDKPRRWRDQVVSASEAFTDKNATAANAGEDFAEEGDRVVAAGKLPRATWVKLGIGAGGALVVTSLLIGRWFTSGGSAQSLPAVPETQASQEGPSAPVSAAAADEPVPARVPLDPRWLPSAAQCVLSIQPGRLERRPEARSSLERISNWWSPAFASLFAAFPFAPADIRRLTWATSALADAHGDDWLAAGLVIVELERPVAEWRNWLDGCDPLDWTLGGSVCLSVPATDWPHPFAVVDERTIVTGPADAMQALSDRGGARTAQTEFEQFVDRLDAGEDLLWALDLAAVRAIDAMPSWNPLVESWHADEDDWRLVRELPRVFSLGLRLEKRLRMELRFGCDGESSAVKDELALKRVISAVEKTRADESDVPGTKRRAGGIGNADPLELLFLATREALDSCEFEREGAMVRIAADWPGDWSAVALAAIASVQEIESSRPMSRDDDPGVPGTMPAIDGDGESAAGLDEQGEPIANADTAAEPELPGEADESVDEAVDGPPADPARPVRPEAEITARLAETIPEIEFEKVPLADVVRTLSDFSTLEIDLDLDSLAELGIKPDAPVTLRLKDASVGDVLAAALADFKLIHVVTEGRVLVTRPISPDSP